MSRSVVMALVALGAVSCGGGATSGGAAAPAAPAQASPTVSPSGAAVAANTGLRFDASKIQLRTDVYEVYVTQADRRMRVGSQTVTIGKDRNTIRIIEQISAVAMGIDGTMSLGISAETGTGISRLETGTWQSESFNSTLQVSEGKLTGTLQTPDPMGGLKTVKVNATVGEFTFVEEDMLFALLPTADLADGMKGEFPILDDQTGTIRTARFTVGKPESVTVPAGKFDAFRVRVQARTQTSYFVTVAQPRRIVRVIPAGGAIELRLVQ